MNKANLGHLKNLLALTKKDLNDLQEKVNEAHHNLREYTKKTEENYENQLNKVNAIPQTRKSVDIYLRGLKILINEENKKKNLALSNIDSAIKTIDSVIEKIEKANKLTTKKDEEKRGEIIQEITGAIPSLIGFIQTVFTNSNYLVSRANSNAYMLYQQPILKDQGIQFAEAQYYLHGIQSAIGNPKDTSSLSSQINFLKTKVGKSGDILAKEKSKGFSFSQQNLEAQQKIDKQKAYDAALRGKLPNIQESELSDAVKASISFINAQKLKIASGEQSDKELEIKKKIEETFGVIAPDIIKYAASGNKKKNITSGKELYQQIKQTRGFGDRPEIDSIGEEMKARFLKNREAKFKPREKSAFETENLENIQSEVKSGGESSPAEVIPKVIPKVESKPIENIQSEVKSGGELSPAEVIPKVIPKVESKPIENIQPEVKSRGESQSPGEVSDEMLKVIEQAVFNGASRAFAQFSNGPSAAQPEFGDTTIDKIGETVFKAMQKALDYYSASPAFRMVLVGIDPSVLDQLKNSLSGLPGSGTGDMDKLAEELRKSRESNENLAKMQEARRKKIEAERKKKAKEAEKEKKRIADPNSPESIAKKKKEAEAAERAQKKKDKEDPNSLENIAKAEEKKRKAEEKKAKEDKAKVKAEIEADPFRKRLKGIYKDSRQEITFLYDKVNSFFPFFNSAQQEAKKTALETLEAGYKAFDEVYASTGSAFKGMMASVNSMFKISPVTVIMAGLTAAFIGILKSANRLNNKIKEISAELGTSNMQSYEFFKSAMNAQTQYDNMYASLRDVRDVQKGILGDSGILLKVNDKALASIADNAKNIGVSTESAGAFAEALRTKGATDEQAANLMAASLELADKSKFIMPQSVMDDIAQNVEFSSKYFSNINKDSKSAQKHLVDTNLQVKALGLNFQKAAKMTQHLLSFEQSIVGEVEATVALGRHVNIGKARELLLQDDIGGAMQQMMDTMGGYDAFQDMDFAKRQLMANAIGLEVSELEKSLYLREKIGITNEDALNAAMKNSDYLDKVAGKDVELYKIEAKKVLAAEQFNTAVEKVSVAFKSSLLPVLEAILPVVEMMASAINFVAAAVKTVVGFPGKILNGITGHKPDSGVASPTAGLEASMNIGMVAVMGGLILKTLKGKLGGKIGEVVGKARGGLDTLTGTLGTKTNPMYVISLGGGGIGGIMDSVGGSPNSRRGGRAGFLKRLTTSKNIIDRAKSIQKIRDARNLSTKTGVFYKIGQYISKVKPSNMLKLGGLLAVASAGYDVYSRHQQGQSVAQAITGTAGGLAGGLLGAKGGAILGAALGTAIAGPVGSAVGGVLGGIVGGATGYYAGGAVVDSQFNKDKKDSSYQIQPFEYKGMGLSATGSIYGGVNNKKATSIPVETSMVDMTPTTFKTTSTGLSGINPNYGMTGVVRESVMMNNVSKNLEATALMSTIKENNIEKEKAYRDLMNQQLKTLESIREKINQPAVAYFTEEGRRQVVNYNRVKNSH